MKNLLLATLLVLTGCATGSHIITGTVHRAISPDGVKIYPTAPAKYEVIGMVAAQCNGRGQTPTDKALQELKKQAAEIGANGILTGTPQQGSAPVPVYTQYGEIMVTGNFISLSGTAIFVQ